VPIYEYRCDDCGNAVDVLQRFSDAPIETCELCGGAVRKVLHPAAIHFKGSGFYTTDYARRSSSGASAGGGDGGDTSHIAGGTDDVPTFKMSDKAKAENRQNKAERVTKLQSEKSSSRK
jgi:putative FmdB family regulatory protein